MKKVLLLSVFILMLTAGMAWSISPSVVLEEPYNIDGGGYFPPYFKYGNGYYDYRDIQYGFPNKCGMMSGEYFTIGILVNLNVSVNPKLTDLSQIVGCKAEALSNDMEFSMSKWEHMWMGWPLQYNLFLRPGSWMFETDWRITLKYQFDGVWYVQEILFPATGRFVRPGRPTNIKIERDSVDPNIVYVKAAPIAPWCDFAPGVRYSARLRIYDENCGVFTDIRTDCELPSPPPPYHGYWDFQTYELVFKIPDAYIGHGGRLEYRLVDTTTGKMVGRSVVQFPIELTQ